MKERCQSACENTITADAPGANCRDWEFDGMPGLTLALAANHFLDLFLCGATGPGARRFWRLLLACSTLQLLAFLFIFYVLCIHLQFDPWC